MFPSPARVVCPNGKERRLRNEIIQKDSTCSGNSMGEPSAGGMLATGVNPERGTGSHAINSAVNAIERDQPVVNGAGDSSVYDECAGNGDTSCHQSAIANRNAAGCDAVGWNDGMTGSPAWRSPGGARSK